MIQACKSDSPLGVLRYSDRYDLQSGLTSLVLDKIQDFEAAFNLLIYKVN